MDVSNTTQILNPDDFASPAAYVATVKALPDPPAHLDDPAMAEEHAALLALVPRSEATHVAVRDGSWFDPATWSDGRIPDAHARVLIPEAISVTYDGESDVSLFTVRVDGELLFAPDQNTRMVVDTLVVAKTGLLQIGTSDHPIQDGVRADIVIADNGPIDVNWDPLLLSRGIISHGSADIHGQEKTSFLKLALDPVAGSTILYFDDDAAQNGWHVGDKIVVTGTHISSQQVNGNWVDIGTQDEVRTIKAIYGTTVILDRPLDYNHDSPRADLKAYVADYTRNVVVETQNADEVPVSQRGHVMFMHSPSVDVEYAEFHELGRTDKSVRAVDAETTTGITSDTNVKGRYALHLHETGVEPGSPETIIKGNAVWGSPGWGIVQHASSADVENNATFDTFGAAYVAETGDETGIWHNNIAINAHGVGAGPWVDKWVDDVVAFDLARSGIGFYFQGRMIKATDNVAADVNEGFVYMVRGSPATIDADNLAQPEILHGLTSSDIAEAPIQNFNDNEVFAAAYGFIVVKANPSQGHDVRSVIDGFTAWETDIGVHLEYTAHYTFLDTDLVGPDLGRISEPGTAGFELSTTSYDIVLNGASIANYVDGINKMIAESTAIPSDSLNYVFIDLNTSDITNEAITNFDPRFDKLLTSAQLNSSPATIQMDWQNIPVWTSNWSVSLEGIKHDDIGAISYANGNETFAISYEQMAGLLAHQGYYTTDDGRRIVVVEEYYSDRASGEIFKTGIPVQIADNISLGPTAWFLPDGALSLGRIDLNAPAPIAHADTASTAHETSVVIDVLRNDVDPNGLAMSVDGLTQPGHGTIKENPDGTLTYTPDNDFAGVETFKYWVTDHNAKFGEGMVTVNVGSADGSPSGTPPNETPPSDGSPGDGPPSDVPGKGGSPGNGPGHDDVPPVVDAPPIVNVPPVVEVPSPPTTPSNPPPVAEDKPADAPAWMGWKFGHVHFDHQQYNHSFDEVGRWHPVGDFFKTAAEALKDFYHQSPASSPFVPVAVTYDNDFGATTEMSSQFGSAGNQFAHAGDHLAWRSSTGAQGDNPLPASSNIDLHQEGFAGSKGLFFGNTESVFAFMNFDDTHFNPAHPETGLLPDIEHHGSVASGFIFA